jgi:hypothetical protein
VRCVKCAAVSTILVARHDALSPLCTVLYCRFSISAQRICERLRVVSKPDLVRISSSAVCVNLHFSSCNHPVYGKPSAPPRRSVARFTIDIMWSTSLILSASLLFAATNAQCFYPDGSPYQGGVICDITQSDGQSSCCGIEDECTTNGFCKWQGFRANNILSVVGCTDRDWRSPHCAQFCTKNCESIPIILLMCGAYAFGD